MLFFQGTDVFIHLLFVQRVPEPQDEGQQGEAQGGHQHRDVEQPRLDGGVGAGGGGVADGFQQQAGQTGGVHPIHVDDMSRTFAARIEQLPSAADANSLVLEMADEYCLLVQQQGMKEMSEPVRFGVLYVRQHLAEPLNLHTVAGAAGMNASYYSALFKKETGQTLTEFILQERMRLAVHLLLSTRLQVQTVAQYCGFLDVNYFSRLFRQTTGLTPTEYRRRGKSLQV